MNKRAVFSHVRRKYCPIKLGWRCHDLSKRTQRLRENEWRMNYALCQRRYVRGTSGMFAHGTCVRLQVDYCDKTPFTCSMWSRKSCLDGTFGASIRTFGKECRESVTTRELTVRNCKSSCCYGHLLSIDHSPRSLIYYIPRAGLCRRV